MVAGIYAIRLLLGARATPVECSVHLHRANANDTRDTSTIGAETVGYIQYGIFGFTTKMTTSVSHAKRTLALWANVHEHRSEILHTKSMH